MNKLEGLTVRARRGANRIVFTLTAKPKAFTKVTGRRDGTGRIVVLAATKAPVAKAPPPPPSPTPSPSPSPTPTPDSAARADASVAAAAASSTAAAARGRASAASAARGLTED